MNQFVSVMLKYSEKQVSERGRNALGLPFAYLCVNLSQIYARLSP